MAEEDDKKAEGTAAAANDATNPDAKRAPAPVEDEAPPENKEPECPECAKCEECPECKSGAPAWMATFADMATLLMAFFVLILSFAEMNVPKFKQINGSLKNSFGIQRLIPVVESPKAQSLIAQHFTPSVAEPTPIDTIRQETTDDRQENVQLKTDVAPEAQQAMQQMQQALAQEISRGEAQVKMEGGKVVVEMNTTPGGGSGPGGKQAGGAGSGKQQGANASSGQDKGGASSGEQAGGNALGASQGGAGSKGSKQAGTVAQGEIEFYAKVADVQAQTATPIEVRDKRAAAGNETGAAQSGSGKGAGKGGDKGGGGPADAESQYQKIRKELANEIQSGKVEVERDGAKIIIRLAEQGSFKSGSADLQPGFMKVISQVGKSVADSQGRVFIEGHTDNVPVMYNERFRSNWDLSGARAGAVADYMSSSSGIAPGRMSVSGYADTRPLEDNNSANGRARNRRIEVIIDGAGG